MLKTFHFKPVIRYFTIGIFNVLIQLLRHSDNFFVSLNLFLRYLLTVQIFSSNLMSQDKYVFNKRISLFSRLEERTC